MSALLWRVVDEMTVIELIEKLKTLPADAVVKTWDPYYDRETAEVCVSTDREGAVWVMNASIGYQSV
jgi:hypothetical protein